jgi:formyltetrahydrofolate synthetase
MGLDQYAGFRDSNGEVHEKFYWRKHARLQKFMSVVFDYQNQKKKEKHNTHSDLQHLGFNGGQGGVKITEEVITKLEEAVKNDYYDFFASDGFFWGQQFQEEQVKEYKAQDEEFIKWAKEQLKAGKDIGYDCSW